VSSRKACGEGRFGAYFFKEGFWPIRVEPRKGKLFVPCGMEGFFYIHLLEQDGSLWKTQDSIIFRKGF